MRNENVDVLVDFYLGALAGQIGHAHPEIGQSAPDAVVVRLLEDGLNVHGELDPVSGRFALSNGCQHRCNNNRK